MKPLSLSLSAVLLLSACQLTPPEQQEEKEEIVNVASPQDINQAILVDPNADVIHPIEDIEFSVNDHANVITEDVWQRIRAKLIFDLPQNQRLIEQRNWYVQHPDYLDRVAKRAEPFLFYIVEELEKNNIPIEIALLPIVESAFDPFAYSHGRASGMWQFIPGTGERFNMKQNWWYDGRRDIIASTQGAIKYLKYLNNFFKGDWLLALAAYNSGEGRVSKAVKNNLRKNKPTDFWSLDLPQETQAYVPKLLALADIIKRPEDFNIKLYEIENKEVVTQIDIGSQLDLAKAAKLANLSLTELQRLNPGFNRWATDPEGPHRLLIPLNKKDEFVAGLNKLPKEERLSWQRYKIKSGDSLGKISEQFNTSVSLIQQVNNIKGSQIRAGKYLLIPVAAQSLDSYILSEEQRISTKQNQQRSGTKITHVVKSGDTLWDLSLAHKISSQQIAKWNGIAPNDTLRVGQELVIWKTAVAPNISKASKIQYGPSEKSIVRNITYKVRSGDSFARIASKFNVAISDIERWNKLSRSKYLQPGQLLRLVVDVTEI